MKSVVTISRHWDNPKITTVINKEGISLSIEMDDFISALKKEIGSVATTITKKTFEAKLDAAVTSILEKIKEESAKVI